MLKLANHRPLRCIQALFKLCFQLRGVRMPSKGAVDGMGICALALLQAPHASAETQVGARRVSVWGRAGSAGGWRA